MEPKVAGWSETGGPWVKPEQAMKKLVWSETVVEGPRSFSGKLPQPPSNNGPIRNLSRGAGRPGPPGLSAPPPDPTYYGDSAVLAYRTPADEVSAADLRPKASTNTGALDAAALLDGDLNTSVTFAAPAGGGAVWVQYEFAQPFKACAISVAGRGGIPIGRVLASDDGVSFRTLASLPGPQGYRGGLVRTFAWPETSARFYRLELTAAPLTPAAVMSDGYEAPYTLKRTGDYRLAQGINRIVFHTSAHQPLDTKPGNTMVGTHINRNITWAELAAPFTTCLARSSFMLQQGLFVADLACLLPEGAPSTMPFWGAGLEPSPPEGYDYDYINTEVLLNRVAIGNDGRLVLPDGISRSTTTRRASAPTSCRIRLCSPTGIGCATRGPGSGSAGPGSSASSKKTSMAAAPAVPRA